MKCLSCAYIHTYIIYIFHILIKSSWLFNIQDLLKQRTKKSHLVGFCGFLLLILNMQCGQESKMFSKQDFLFRNFTAHAGGVASGLFTSIPPRSSKVKKYWNMNLALEKNCRHCKKFIDHLPPLLKSLGALNFKQVAN